MKVNEAKLHHKPQTTNTNRQFQKFLKNIVALDTKGHIKSAHQQSQASNKKNTQNYNYNLLTYILVRDIKEYIHFYSDLQNKNHIYH